MKRKFNRTNVIIDSDVTNNVDDMFAICYALSNSLLINVLAVTIEPYKNIARDISVDEMQLESSAEVRRIMTYMGIKRENFIFRGSEDFISNGYNQITPAVKQMVELSEKFKDLTIIATGALTNVAMFIKFYPEHAKNIKIIWLGTGNLMLDLFSDLNYLSDKDAFEIVAKSGVDFSVIPNYVARHVVSSVYEIEHNMHESAIGKYLLKAAKESENTNNLGIKTIYDVVPVGYVLHPEFFQVKDISVNELLKEQSKLESPHAIHYVFEMKANAVIWRDVVRSINGYAVNPFPSKVFFISDTHFTQRRKIALRQVPWQSVEESDDEIVRRWNSVVSKNDTVYHLGDFGNYEVIKKLNGKVILICGNYEEEDIRAEGFENFKKKLLALGFAEVYEKGIYLDESVLGERVFLTHRPLTHAKDCMSLFGHVHTLAPVKKFGFNVCLAYHNYTPISANTAKRYLDFIKNHSDADVFA